MTQEQMPEKIWAARFGDLDHGDWVGTTDIDPQLEGGVLFVRADIAERNARIAEVAKELGEIVERVVYEIKRSKPHPYKGTEEYYDLLLFLFDFFEIVPSGRYFDRPSPKDALAKLKAAIEEGKTE